MPKAISCASAGSNACNASFSSFSSFSTFAVARQTRTPPGLALAGDRCVAALSLLVLLALAIEGLLH